MTYPEAIALRERARKKQPVNPAAVMQAEELINKVRSAERQRMFVKVQVTKETS